MATFENAPNPSAVAAAEFAPKEIVMAAIGENPPPETSTVVVGGPIVGESVIV
jgi:hypothetical protein